MTTVEMLQSVLNYYKDNGLCITKGVYGVKIVEGVYEACVYDMFGQCIVGAIAAAYKVPAIISPDFDFTTNLISSTATYMNLSISQLASLEMGFEAINKKDRFFHLRFNQEVDEEHYELGRNFRERAEQMGLYRKTIFENLGGVRCES